jgi:hypothetical protein
MCYRASAVSIPESGDSESSGGFGGDAQMLYIYTVIINNAVWLRKEKIADFAAQQQPKSLCAGG